MPALTSVLQREMCQRETYMLETGMSPLACFGILGADLKHCGTVIVGEMLLYGGSNIRKKQPRIRPTDA